MAGRREEVFLSDYRMEYDVEALRQIPKTRKKFVLQ